MAQIQGHSQDACTSNLNGHLADNKVPATFFISCEEAYCQFVLGPKRVLLLIHRFGYVWCRYSLC